MCQALVNKVIAHKLALLLMRMSRVFRTIVQSGRQLPEACAYLTTDQLSRDLGHPTSIDSASTFCHSGLSDVEG